MVSQTQPRSTGKTQISRELFEQIMNEYGECDTKCFDSMLKAGKVDVYIECMDKCIAEICRKFDIPIERLIEVLVNGID